MIRPVTTRLRKYYQTVHEYTFAYNYSFGLPDDVKNFVCVSIYLTALLSQRNNVLFLLQGKQNDSKQRRNALNKYLL